MQVQTLLPILFVCCDMGETNALIPVMQKLHEDKIEFKVLAMGAALTKLEGDFSLKDRVIPVKEEVSTATNCAKPLADVAAAIGTLQARVVISGPASKAQEQILAAIRADKKIVYLDNFNYVTSSESFQTVKGVAKVAQKTICVARKVKQILETPQGFFTDKNIKLLGRPSLKNWVTQVNRVDLRATVKKIGFNLYQPIVTIIGGYGRLYDEGVNDAYQQATTSLEEVGYQVHIQHHPNIINKQPLTTIEAVGMADYVICYDSIAGFESLFANKKVIFLQPSSVPLSDNDAIKEGLAPRVRTAEELVQILDKVSGSQRDPYEVLGVPRDSTAAITQYLLKKAKLIVSK